MTTKPKPTARVVSLFRYDDCLENVPEVGVSYTPEWHEPGGSFAVSAMEPTDLAGRPPVWLLIGGGSSGKTVEARWLTWRMAEGGRFAELVALVPYVIDCAWDFRIDGSASQ